jgi:hypothetical protein
MFPATTMDAAPARRPDCEVIARLSVEHVAVEDEHRAVYGDVVAPMDLADNAEMVGESLVG